jgi:hypothetical protein
MQRSEDNKSALWGRRRAQYRNSGLSRRAFCEKHHLKRSTLDYWFCRLGKQERAWGLVELNPASTAQRRPSVVLSIGQDCRIEIHAGFDPQLLGEVARALGGLR